MNLEEQNLERSKELFQTPINNIRTLSLKKQHYSSESIQSPTLFDDCDDSPRKKSEQPYQSDLKSQKNQTDNYIFSDPAHIKNESKQMHHLFKAQGSNVSQSTMNSNTEITVTALLKNDVISSDKSKKQGMQERKTSDILQGGIQFHSSQDEVCHNKVNRNLLFVQTNGLATKKKPRLMQSSTIEFNQPEFQISVEKLASLSEMEERIMAYFTTEGIELQHVSEFLKDQNLGAFKGMGKLSSPMKLDITKSPLRRHRANTICL